ncbi:MAG: hypothetical protein AAGJ35_14325, partial [Myxococcota bacterium]
SLFVSLLLVISLGFVVFYTATSPKFNVKRKMSHFQRAQEKDYAQDYLKVYANVLQQYKQQNPPSTWSKIYHVFEFFDSHGLDHPVYNDAQEIWKDFKKYYPLLPKHAYAHLAHAIAHRHTARIKRILTRLPTKTNQPTYLKARAYQILKNHVRAQRLYHALCRQKFGMRPCWRYAQILYAQREYKKAKSLFLQAYQVAPKHLPLLIDMLNAHIVQPFTQSLYDSIHQNIDYLLTNSSPAPNLLAKVHFVQARRFWQEGETQRAYTSSQKSYLHFPKHPQVLHQFLQHALWSGKHHNARTQLQRKKHRIQTKPYDLFLLQAQVYASSKRTRTKLLRALQSHKHPQKHVQYLSLLLHAFHQQSLQHIRQAKKKL